MKKNVSSALRTLILVGLAKKAVLLLAATLFWSCGKSSDVKVPSIGQSYQIFVVSEPQTWNSPVRDTLDTIFSEQVEMINQPEPIYDLFYTQMQNFNTVASKIKNLIILQADSVKYPTSDMKASFDVYAAPQLILTVTGPSNDSLAAFVSEYRHEMVKMFDIAERERGTKRAEQHPNKEIVARIQEKFGFHLSIPEGYTVRKDTTDFLWVSFELPESSIGFSIYTYPTDTSQASHFKAGNILLNRDLAVMQIPGPLPDSYMATNTLVYPDQKLLQVHGRAWSQVRGFWEVRGDFMGGPFINYTTYDARNNRMIAIDGYVYCPSPNARMGKRDFVRQIEAIFMTAEVPE